jgi:hypothetical protein
VGWLCTNSCCKLMYQAAITAKVATAHKDALCAYQASAANQPP